MIFREGRNCRLTLLTISDVGSTHRTLQMPNQDAADFYMDGNDFVLAISDGVGSCPKAEVGSRNAVLACIHVFTKIKDGAIEFVDESIINAIINGWQSSFELGNADDCCATLKAIFKIGQAIKTVSIGDGFIAISSDGEHLISPVEETEFINMTNCLSSKVSSCDFWVGDFSIEHDKPYAAFCCTDGVANGIMAGQEINLIEDIEKNTSSNRLQIELEALLKDISDYCFDDKTVGVVKYE